MNPHHVHWYMKEQEKRKRQQEENDIDRINRQLQKLLLEVTGLAKADHKDLILVAQRSLVHSPVLGMVYRNNFVSKEVVRAQAVLIAGILAREEGLHRGYQERLERCIAQFGNVDYGESGRIRREMHYVQRRA